MTRKGWQGAVLKVYGGKDFQVQVMHVEPVTDSFVRLRVQGAELLDAAGWHPTMWVRLWFTDDRGRPHQRAYTVIDPQDDGTFAIEVHVHDGPAARTLAGARPGQVLDATLQGTGFEVPDGEVDHVHLVGDAASVPAIRTVLEALPSTPATVWLEQQEESEAGIPLTDRADVTVHRVDRTGEGDGTPLVRGVTAAWSQRAASGTDLSREWFWLAPEAAACRALGKHLRKELEVPKDRVTALAYWRLA